MKFPEIMSSKEDWLIKRSKYFTASQIYRLLGSKDENNLSKGGITYVNETIDSFFGAFKEEVWTEDIQRGFDLEPKAFVSFCKDIGLDKDDLSVHYFGVEEPAVYRNDKLRLLSSPDAVLMDLNNIVEIKCPRLEKHQVYAEIMDFEANDWFKKNRKDYYSQMQLNIFLSDADFCYFVSYCEDYIMDTITIKIERDDEFIDKILNFSKLANDMFKEKLMEFKIEL
jgi:hypothetical protein